MSVQLQLSKKDFEILEEQILPQFRFCDTALLEKGVLNFIFPFGFTKEQIIFIGDLNEK